MNTHSKTDPLPANIHPRARRGIELFNKGEYFEAHEALESAWLETGSPERDLYQGILQIGLAYYQISRGNYGGAIKMFKRGQRKLDLVGDSMLGINIGQLREDASAVELELRAKGHERIGEIKPDQFKPLPLDDQFLD